ncbi:hypothetical protein OU789_15780 [Halocynthiibacter sp. C4]|uniref:hypothetical protein n=1 Tax=Halocynthiibacter sp. C4 TaxID=2992758 RepID=UPI00237BC536|nr:hypothetical protein [Halocynthiibacter sp. C4]MDE0591397.1 hypothetical protein [Halocynthiibacter sp. C4]
MIGPDIEISCSPELWPVEQLCSVARDSTGLAYVECMGGELAEVEARCEVLMYDEDIGDLLC